MNAQEYLRNYNLVSTRSVGRIEDVLYPEFNANLASTSYSNCVNVYQFLCDFNKKYQEFKKDLKQLVKLDALEGYSITSYFETPFSQTLQYSKDSEILYFLSMSNYYKLVKGTASDVERKTCLPVDQLVAKQYLAFGKKYQDLFNEYYLIVNVLKEVNVNNGIVLSVEFDRNDLFNLEYIMLSFGMYKTNFKTKFLLNEDLVLDGVGNCSLYKFSDEEIEKIAKSIYVNKSFVYGLYAFEDNKTLMRK